MKRPRILGIVMAGGKSERLQMVTLVPVLERDASRPGTHDFGRNIVPELLANHHVDVYDLLNNDIPGLHLSTTRGR